MKPIDNQGWIQFCPDNSRGRRMISYLALRSVSNPSKLSKQSLILSLMVAIITLGPFMQRYARWDLRFKFVRNQNLMIIMNFLLVQPTPSNSITMILMKHKN